MAEKKEKVSAEEQEDSNEEMTYPELYQAHIDTIGNEDYKESAKETMTQAIEPSSSSQRELLKGRKESPLLMNTDGLFKKGKAVMEETYPSKKKNKRRRKKKKANKENDSYRPQFIHSYYGPTDINDGTLTGGFSTSDTSTVSEGVKFEAPNSRITKLIAQINQSLSKKKLL